MRRKERCDVRMAGICARRGALVAVCVVVVLVLLHAPPAIGQQQRAADCTPAIWAPARAPAKPLLGSPAFVRSSDMIVSFRLNDVAPRARLIGDGGITPETTPWWGPLHGCSDSPSGELAEPGASVLHEGTNLRIEIVSVEPAGTSGRHWPGARCAYRLADPTDSSLYVTLSREVVPAFNEIVAVAREGAAIWAGLSFNGYAREIQGSGNVVVAADLCRHEIVWRSGNLVSNAALLRLGPYLIAGYGFTGEKRNLTVFASRTGTVVQRVALPKAPSDMRLQDGALFVRLYDGYARLALREDLADQ
ncbi:MAG: hypothetical protein HYV63_17675 [Candidatus Schekmanbacteria bacterium]|nr:hypothetical protein [Candidatus Schekmanbacteria bacterium]